MVLFLLVFEIDNTVLEFTTKRLVGPAAIEKEVCISILFKLAS